MVSESEGHSSVTPKFRIIAINTVERQGFEGIVKELVPALALPQGRPKNDLPADLIPNQLLYFAL
jgi:hypothetical protein